MKIPPPPSHHYQIDGSFQRLEALQYIAVTCHKLEFCTAFLTCEECLHITLFKDSPVGHLFLYNGRLPPQTNHSTSQEENCFVAKQNERTKVALGISGRGIDRIASKVDLRLQLFWFQEECIFYRNSSHEYLYDTTQSSPRILVQAVDTPNDHRRSSKTLLEKSLLKFSKQRPELFPEVLCPSPLDDTIAIIWRNEKDDSQTCTLFDVWKEPNVEHDIGASLSSFIQTFTGIRNMAWLNNGNAFALLVVDEKGIERLVLNFKEGASSSWKQFIFMEMEQKYGSMDLHTSHDSAYVMVHIQSLHDTEILLLPTTNEKKSVVDNWKRIQLDGINQMTHGGNYFYWIHRSSYKKPQVVYMLKDLENFSTCIQLGSPLQDSVLLDLYVTKDYIVVLCRQQTYLYLFKTKCSTVPYDDLISKRSKDRNEDNVTYYPQWESVTFPFKTDSASFCRQSDSWSYTCNKILVYVASPTVPVQLYSLDLTTGSLHSVLRRKQQSLSWNSCSLSSFEWHRLWTRKDRTTGTSSIPYTIVHKKGLGRNGRTPLLLESYGCYGESLDTQLSPSFMLLLEQGWILCFAHIRGGGELGSNWHLAGTQQGKHISKDDILTVIQTLVDQQWTKPGQIFARTFSAGAIALLHAVYEQPEIFGGSLKDSYLDYLEFGDSWTSICPWRRFNARFLRIRRSLFPWKTPMTIQSLVRIQEDYRWFLRLPNIFFQVKEDDDCVPAWMAYKFVYGYEFTKLCMHLSPCKEDTLRNRNMTVYTWKDAGKHHSPFPTLASAMELAFWNHCMRRKR
ncbi:Protease 2 [Galdieria sulphuraria]|nr:Protease 2 [Galdieria sulphuraria]